MSKQIPIFSEERDYYCSMKFRFLKIDMVSESTYNCHAATPHKIDFEWLKDNPGEIFNSPVNVNDRELMLENKRNKNCEQNCWHAEDRNAVSPRLTSRGNIRTHDAVFTKPEIIDATINADCNLTCSYCCKEFSTSWKMDLARNGDYMIPGYQDPRYVLSAQDRLMLGVSQPELKRSENFQILLNEIDRSLPTLKKLVITGGEPFLDNTLVDLLTSREFSSTATIQIYSGLGVKTKRFHNIINAIKHIPGLDLIISAENIGPCHEFNRYGSQWSDFQEKINILKTIGVNYRFQSTISNLTIFGYRDFVETYHRPNNILSFAYQPRFMAPYVLDPDSKELLLKQWQGLPADIVEKLKKSIESTPTQDEKNSIREFLKQFVARRKNICMDIFPITFLKWIGV